MLFWHTPMDCTASLDEEPPCDTLGIEPSSSSSTGEGSQGFSNCSKRNNFLMLSLELIQLSGHAQQPHTQCPTQQLSRKPASSSEPAAQKQELQWFSRLSLRLMEVSQSMILVPKSPLIDQSNNSALWFLTMSSPAGPRELPLCAQPCPKLDSTSSPFGGLALGCHNPAHRL